MATVGRYVNLHIRVETCLARNIVNVRNEEIRQV